MTIPRLLTQLDNGAPTSGDDCSVMTLLNAVRWASDGRAGPRHHAEVDDWVADVRRWAGKPRGGLLFRGDTLQAYQHPQLAARLAREGVRMRVEYRQGISWDALTARLRSGWFVHLAVHYGVLNDGRAPSGSTSFRGGHSIALVEPHRSGGRLMVRDGDPLFDGRRRGIPDGWTDARLIDFKRAAGAWGAIPPGYGKATAIFIKGG